MAYDVSIVRTQSGRQHPITEVEISEAIREMPGWQFDPATETLEFSIKGQSCFWMFVGDGGLWAKEPTEEQIELMIQLAETLGGRVRGDDFETYRTPAETFLHPDDAVELKQQQRIATERATRVERRNRLIDRIQIVALVILILNFLAYVIYGLLTKGSA